MVGKPAWHRTL